MRGILALAILFLYSCTVTVNNEEELPAEVDEPGVMSGGGSVGGNVCSPPVVMEIAGQKFIEPGFCPIPIPMKPEPDPEVRDPKKLIDPSQELISPAENLY